MYQITIDYGRACESYPVNNRTELAIELGKLTAKEFIKIEIHNLKKSKVETIKEFTLPPDQYTKL